MTRIAVKCTLGNTRTVSADQALTWSFGDLVLALSIAVHFFVDRISTFSLTVSFCSRVSSIVDLSEKNGAAFVRWHDYRSLGEQRKAAHTLINRPTWIGSFRFTHVERASSRLTIFPPQGRCASSVALCCQNDSFPTVLCVLLQHSQAVARKLVAIVCLFASASQQLTVVRVLCSRCTFTDFRSSSDMCPSRVSCSLRPDCFISVCVAESRL